MTQTAIKNNALAESLREDILDSEVNPHTPAAIRLEIERQNVGLHELEASIKEMEQMTWSRGGRTNYDLRWDEFHPKPKPSFFKRLIRCFQ